MIVTCFWSSGEFARHGNERLVSRWQKAASGFMGQPVKLTARFGRTLANLHRAIRDLPCVVIFDNSDLQRPFRKVAEFEHGKAVSVSRTVPGWLKWP